MKSNIVYKILIVLAGIAGFALGIKKCRKENEERQKLAEKNSTQFILANQWIKLCRKGGSISTYLIEKGYRKIAVYGMSYLGENVVAELKDSSVKVVYGIDKMAGGIASEIDIYSMKDDLPQVDAVIVSETFYFTDIKPQLSEKLHCPVISLEEVIYES